jgi:hypothetical protein
MKYLLLIYTNPANWALLTEEERDGLLAEYAAITREITKTGEHLGGSPLADPGTATTVRVRGGRRDLTDGPFAEAKEHLAGYYLVDCESLDRAIALAERLPDARLGGVEIRPVPDTGGTEI